VKVEQPVSDITEAGLVGTSADSSITGPNTRLELSADSSITCSTTRSESSADINTTRQTTGLDSEFNAELQHTGHVPIDPAILNTPVSSDPSTATDASDTTRKASKVSMGAAQMVKKGEVSSSNGPIADSVTINGKTVSYIKPYGGDNLTEEQQTENSRALGLAVKDIVGIQEILVGMRIESAVQRAAIADKSPTDDAAPVPRSNPTTATSGTSAPTSAKFHLQWIRSITSLQSSPDGTGHCNRNLACGLKTLPILRSLARTGLKNGGSFERQAPMAYSLFCSGYRGSAIVQKRASNASLWSGCRRTWSLFSRKFQTLLLLRRRNRSKRRQRGLKGRRWPRQRLGIRKLKRR
jgi:hypothetical protein